MQFYQENYVTYSRSEAERVSAIPMPASKRNGRKQEQHIKIMNAIREIEHPNGVWRNKDGRPQKSKIVEEWQRQHPDGKKIECERETGLSRHTVLKWWSCEARKGTNKSRNVERGSLVQEKQEKVIKAENRDVYAEYRGISSEMDRLLRRIERMDARLKELGDTTDERLRSERKMLHHSVWEAKNELNKMYRDKK